MSKVNDYDDFSYLYDILVPIQEGYDTEFVKYLHYDIFQKYHVQSVLDCACGTGHQSIGLAKWGYDVTSSDFSAEMVNILNAKSDAYNVNLNITHVDWGHLSEKFGIEKFDALLCAGNCLYHYSDSEKSKYLAEMCKVLKPEGIAFIDYEWWDEEFREIGRDRFKLYDHIEHEGRNIISAGIYEHEGRKQILTVYFFIEHNKTIEVKNYVFTGYAFSTKELFELARKSGFSSMMNVKRPGIWNLNAMLAIK
jgi:SAM-dependent methyltransferase